LFGLCDAANKANLYYTCNMLHKIVPYLMALGILLLPTIGLGQVYPEVKIGTQVWMSKNLDVSTFRNGDPIPEAKTAEEWGRARENHQPAWCYYDNDTANGAKYGKLYNWYAVNDPRGLAPIGWHISTDSEWNQLTVFLGNHINFGDYRDKNKSLHTGKLLKSNSGWKDDGNGTTRSGFCGLPGGIRAKDAEFAGILEGCTWWTSTKSKMSNAWHYYLHYSNDYIVRFDGADAAVGQSVRCLKDK
jgi:uncharacterized protein (TIGR02145 family)